MPLILVDGRPALSANNGLSHIVDDLHEIWEVYPYQSSIQIAPSQVTRGYRKDWPDFEIEMLAVAR